ncbi:MAG: acetate kinase [Bacilli bacterium]|nr:acetate kinase [Bacilli bacterium]
MKEKYLVINAGSSSLKFSLYTMPEAKEIVNGLVERIGNEDSCYTLKYDGKKQEKNKVIMNHTEAVKTMLEELLANNFISDINEIKGVGHRVLHGAEIYKESTLINEETLRNLEGLVKFGPLHLPGAIAGIKSMMQYLDVPQVAVFDTSFHNTIPEENYRYAVPEEFYTQDGVRKYGFHGTSYRYITKEMQKRYEKEDVNLIICHVGSGASMCCVKDGKSYDTTMGLTPLAGLIMGTRSGDIDPSIIEYICKERNLTVSEVTNILNKKSGLLGIAGKNDNRDLESARKNGDKKATLALEMLKNSIEKYIGQYYIELKGKVDAIVFTAGIGENAISLRESIINDISVPLNIKLNKEMNDNISRRSAYQGGKISTPDSSIEVLVLPTNEEYMILKDTYEISKKIEEKIQEETNKKVLKLN